MSDVLTPFLSATIRTATPLALAALGEVFVERAGLINLGLEGAILAGAFGSLVGATVGGLTAGYLGAVFGGVVVAVIFAVFVVWFRADQIITGALVLPERCTVSGTARLALRSEFPRARRLSFPGWRGCPLLALRSLRSLS
jgi:ABC-type uncharacterized transport system permease subunit